MSLADTMIDLARAELKASRIVRRWPNMALSKQYQLRAMALYLLYRRSRPAPEEFWVGKYRADYSPLSAEEIAASQPPEMEELFRNSAPVNRRAARS